MHPFYPPIQKLIITVIFLLSFSSVAGAVTIKSAPITLRVGSWILCANEYATCSFTGEKLVRYGTETQNFTKNFSGGTICDNSTFGDPAPGLTKMCWYFDTTPQLPPGGTGTVTTKFTASSEDFLNPERGFYVSVKDGEMTVTSLTGFVNEWRTRLFLYVVNLSSYRSVALPQSFLDTLNSRFDQGRAAGIKFIVQFAYNFDSSGVDAPINIVLQHISQLKPVLEKNADVIPFMKAGFIGAYGEWWGSTNNLESPANRTAIKDALMANTPATTIVHFTASSDFANWFPNNPTGATSARLGFHNDCYMANDTDAHQFTGLTDPMRTYMKNLGENGGFGGETCDDVSNPEQRRTSCSQALSEGAAYHLTWLNQAYAPLFINSWKTNGCFTEISRTMGYRLRIESVTHPASISRNSTATVTVALSNVGWARVLSKKLIVVTLKHKTTGALISGTANTELRTVAAGTTAQININVPISAAATTGDYEVQIGIPDTFSTTASDARYSIRPANADSGLQIWNATTGRLSTGAVLRVN